MNVATTLLKHAWHTRVVLNQAQFHGPFAPLQRHPKKSAANVEPWHASWNPVMRQSSGRPTENHERKLEEPILGVTFHTGWRHRWRAGKVARLQKQRKTYGQSVRSSDVYTQAFYVLGHPKSISTIALMGTFFPTPPLQRFLRFSPKPLGMPPSDWLHAPWI